ncbi:MAG: 3'-5' exonuclease domain-containing protein 2 [Bacteroidales bacterium]|nr:3'-5' exonuclease domain-containing protein 2 [Bacteroidales bacterium]
MLKNSQNNETPLKVISKEEINKLPVLSYTGEIVVVSTAEDAENSAMEMMQERIFGFDTETKPVFVSGKSNNIALIQIAGEKKVWIFLIQHFTIGTQFRTFLEDERFLKIGVAIGDDVKKLRRSTGITARGMFELAHLSKKVGLLESGLRTLTAKVFDYKLSKRQQTSNWESNPLSEAQIIYAATDAWICRKLYFEMMNVQKKME